MTTTAVGYSRLSVEDAESVSLDRQAEAIREYIARQGWTLAGEFSDVVSGDVPPAKRPGWRAATAVKPDVLVIWALDRMGRLRQSVFWQAYAALEEAGIDLVSVTQSLDTTTALGRGFMGLQMTTAEAEREAISKRVAAARGHLLRAGRSPGGATPYGYMNVANPDGPGKVLVQDPATIGVVRDIVSLLQQGRTIHSVVQRLNEQGIPSPTGQSNWRYSTVERLARNPILGGQIPYTPGNKTKERGAGVVRGADGLPVVRKDLAIMTPAQHKALVARLDGRDSPQTRPRTSRRKTDGTLAGLLWCAECDVRMWRGTLDGKPSYSCPECHMSARGFQDDLLAVVLGQVGDEHRWSPMVEVVDGGAAEVQEVAFALADVAERLVASDDPEESARLVAQMAYLKERRAEAEAMPVVTDVRPVRLERTVGEDYHAAIDDEGRRDVLSEVVARIVVSRPVKAGRPTRESRLERFRVEWAHLYEPRLEPSQEDLAAWAS